MLGTVLHMDETLEPVDDVFPDTFLDLMQNVWCEYVVHINMWEIPKRVLDSN